ncbi:VWA domain-containing protein [Parashewanella spongiae]|uniref:VWA domain-containing protein n=1 Tax=Parashewanella spongiae TaxID=342950 RepID=A0A3A6UAX7_9GAMM|nr:VWA domain-containing protein [Parashewanella spongiae]MCL1076891.1 VWA domain-containing protein [Parashewanella spongiae]RJY19141.1 VWA domain-containing protein [Parashewanella spongiae]
MLTLIWPWLLLLLPLPLIFKNQQKPQQGGHLLLPTTSTTQLIGTISTKFSRRWYWAMWVLLVFAVARPQWLGEPIELPSKGRDLMVALDLSGSMQIEDMVLDNKTVDRFTLVQKVVSEFIERRKGDRIGLILFADHAYLQSPLTLDRRSVATYLQESQIGLVGKQTAIGEAIGLAVKRFDRVEDSNRILILLTDGTNNAGKAEPTQAAEIAAKRGITIYTIGVGASVIEKRSIFGRQRVNPSSDLGEATLEKIAAMTGGQYFRAKNTEELERIYQVIDQLQPVSRDQQTYRPRSELFYWPLSIMLIISVILNMSKLSLFNRFNTAKVHSQARSQSKVYQPKSNGGHS